MYPGRKNLLWFAESFPVIVFPTAAQQDQIRQNHAIPGYLDKERQTENLFTLSKIAVYPIAAQGMMSEHIMEADAAGRGSPGGAGHVGSSADSTMAPYTASAAGRADSIYAMEQLAASTGGKAFYNTNDLNGAMLRAINDGAHYYTIGYSPTNENMDGRYRQIEVKLTEGKYTLAYRHGYNADQAAPTQSQSDSNPLSDLLVAGLPGASGMLYGVRIEPVTGAAEATRRAGENLALQGTLTRYAVDFVIRPDDVGWLTDSQGGRSGEILVGLKAYDRDGNAINWEGTMQTMQVSAVEYAALAKKGIPARIEIDLPVARDMHLVTAVYDWNSGKAGTLEIPVGRRRERRTSGQVRANKEPRGQLSGTAPEPRAWNVISLWIAGE